MNKNRRMRFFDTVKYAFFIDLSRLKDWEKLLFLDENLCGL